MKQRRDNSKKSIQRRRDSSTTEPDSYGQQPDCYVIEKAKGPLVAQNAEQERYIKSIKSRPVTIGLGRAGTGKSYIAGALAAQALDSREIKRIILTRPAKEAGEELGFLPGEIEQKYEPYVRPFRDVLYERLGKSHVDAMIKGGRIECIPLAYMRGTTFNDAILILDEAQNTTVAQMKMFLTRAGRNSSVIVNGDLDQIDIKEPSGLADAVGRFSGHPSFGLVKLIKSVRSDLCQEILDAYES